MKISPFFDIEDGIMPHNTLFWTNLISFLIPGPQTRKKALIQSLSRLCVSDQRYSLCGGFIEMTQINPCKNLRTSHNILFIPAFLLKKVLHFLEIMSNCSVIMKGNSRIFRLFTPIEHQVDQMSHLLAVQGADVFLCKQHKCVLSPYCWAKRMKLKCFVFDLLVSIFLSEFRQKWKKKVLRRLWFIYLSFCHCPNAPKPSLIFRTLPCHSFNMGPHSVCLVWLSFLVYPWQYLC